MDVTVGYDGLRDAAARLRSGRQDLTSALRSLKALIGDLANSDFRTQLASERFQESYRRWTSGAQNMIESLDGMAGSLDVVVTQFQDLDSRLAGNDSGHDGQLPGTDANGDPAADSDTQLALDSDPAPRLGETPEQAAGRAQAAESKLKLRRATEIYDALGEQPPRLNIVDNDKEYSGRGAHTIETHGPNVPLAKIEGRIHGVGWNHAENWSYRWIDESTMTNVIRDYVRTNWEEIRSELALHFALPERDVPYERIFNAKRLVGEGFFNKGMWGIGPRVARESRTNFVNIKLRLDEGPPPRVFVLDAFPTESFPPYGPIMLRR